MLYSIEGMKILDSVHPKKFAVVRKRLADIDYRAVCKALNSYFDDHGAKDMPLTSSYIPGTKWVYPYESLWHAAGNDWNLARLFFGQIVWRVVMGRSDKWYFRPGDKRANGDPLGMTYLRAKDMD